MSQPPKKPRFPIATIVAIFFLGFMLLPVWLAAPEAAPIVTAVFVPFTLIAVIAIRYSQKEEEYQEHQEKINKYYVCEYCGTRFERAKYPEMCPHCGADY
ncbi:MAG: hypothetical protein GF364_12790 [Candidatus Lokiarchaeota archaeon]|nr:hypothetical protein [Candidatus Lokiarchaeota archaeon]